MANPSLLHGISTIAIASIAHNCFVSVLIFSTFSVAHFFVNYVSIINQLL